MTSWIFLRYANAYNLTFYIKYAIGVQLLKQGLHLEIFDPSRRMIEPGKDESKLVAVVGNGRGDDDHL